MKENGKRKRRLRKEGVRINPKIRPKDTPASKQPTQLRPVGIQLWTEIQYTIPQVVHWGISPCGILQLNDSSKHCRPECSGSIKPYVPSSPVVVSSRYVTCRPERLRMKPYKVQAILDENSFVYPAVAATTRSKQAHYQRMTMATPDRSRHLFPSFLARRCTTTKWSIPAESKERSLVR